MKTLKDIPNLAGVKVFLRADFNVPIQDNKVVDDFRVRAALPTIQFLKNGGAKIILASHLEAADGGNPSLEPVAHKLKELGISAKFVKDYKKALTIIDTETKNGECVLLENLRFFEEEKKNDPKFAKQLASLADIYVNDAFPVAHREHASVVGVPKYLPSYAGLQIKKEVINLSRAFHPNHPFLFILGGAKFETKLPLMAKFMDIADIVFVGGALASDFYKLKGYEVGVSLLSKGNIDLKPFLNSPKLLLPSDVMTAKGEVKKSDALAKDDKIMDSGSETVKALLEKVGQAKFILWNGPLGLYEDGYRGPTLELARMIGEATAKSSDVVSIVGGGDTIAAIATLGIQDKFTFISTGGGAMLEFLAKETLPGIEALNDSNS